MVCTFYNLIQAMLDHGGGDINKLYSGTITFLLIAMVGVTLAVINAFLLVIMYFVGVRL